MDFEDLKDTAEELRQRFDEYFHARQIFIQRLHSELEALGDILKRDLQESYTLGQAANQPICFNFLFDGFTFFLYLPTELLTEDKHLTGIDPFQGVLDMTVQGKFRLYVVRRGSPVQIEDFGPEEVENIPKYIENWCLMHRFEDHNE